MRSGATLLQLRVTGLVLSWLRCISLAILLHRLNSIALILCRYLRGRRRELLLAVLDAGLACLILSRRWCVLLRVVLLGKLCLTARILLLQLWCGLGLILQALLGLLGKMRCWQGCLWLLLWVVLLGNLCLAALVLLL